MRNILLDDVAICGRRGDRGVCAMDWDHCGTCETRDGAPIHLTKEESGWRRFSRIMDDFAFMAIWTAQHGNRDVTGTR